jgi:hypothetical protein
MDIQTEKLGGKTMPALYLSTNKTAGDEISSTYEGRHITIEESLLVHPYHADGLVDKGDPCYVASANGSGIVGVAFKSAVAATDLIAIDTEGIWFLNVYGQVSDGTSDGIALALAAGDPVFIEKYTAGNAATLVATLSGQSDTYHFLPFGYVLGDVSASVSTPTLVAVKVHNFPIPANARLHIGSGTTANHFALLEGSTVLRRNKGEEASYAPESIILAGEEVYGKEIRVEDNLASTGGTLAALLCRAVVNNAANVLGAVLAVKASMDNKASNAIPAMVGYDINMTGAGTAPGYRTAFQVTGDGTAGTLESWFKAEIARPMGMKAQAQSLNQNSIHKIPINIDGVIEAIPTVAWA